MELLISLKELLHLKMFYWKLYICQIVCLFLDVFHIFVWLTCCALIKGSTLCLQLVEMDWKWTSYTP